MNSYELVYTQAATNAHAGSPLQDILRVWAEENRPSELRHLIIALIQYRLRERRGLWCLQSVLVEGEGVVNIPASVLCEVQQTQLRTVSSTVYVFR